MDYDDIAKPSIEELKLLMKRYENEISTLWQRSIFAASFFLASLGGYAKFFLEQYKLLKDKNISNKYIIFNLFSDFSFNLVCLVICTFAIITSFIWFLMAKGSKHVCEALEKKIYIKSYNNHAWDFHQTFYEKDKIKPELIGSAPYSVGKLNIILPFVFFVTSCITALIHLGCILL